MVAPPPQSSDPAAATTTTAALPPPPATATSSSSSSNPSPRHYLSSSTIAPPLLPLPPHFSAQSILGRPPTNPPPPPQGILFPVPPPPGRVIPSRSTAAVGRVAPQSDQVVTVANAAGFIRNNGGGAILAFPGAAQARSLGFAAAEHAAQIQQQQQAVLHSMRPPPPATATVTAVAQQLVPHFVVPRQVVGTAGGGGMPGPPPLPPPRGVPVATPLNPKVTMFPTISSHPEHNNYKDLRDKGRDDTVILMNDRKVRLLDGASGSLYALCRSWIRNGLPQESQPNFGDGVRYLPRPLPPTVAKTVTSKKNEGNGEDGDPDKEEDVGPADNLSTQDLLKGHIKRAKRVRARLREERLQRIERYKQRLSLLLPLPMEQCRNDVAPGS